MCLTFTPRLRSYSPSSAPSAVVGFPPAAGLLLLKVEDKTADIITMDAYDRDRKETPTYDSALIGRIIRALAGAERVKRWNREEHQAIVDRAHAEALVINEARDHAPPPSPPLTALQRYRADKADAAELLAAYPNVPEGHLMHMPTYDGVPNDGGYDTVFPDVADLYPFPPRPKRMSRWEALRILLFG